MSNRSERGLAVAPLHQPHVPIGLSATDSPTFDNQEKKKKKAKKVTGKPFFDEQGPIVANIPWSLLMTLTTAYVVAFTMCWDLAATERLRGSGSGNPISAV